MFFQLLWWNEIKFEGEKVKEEYIPASPKSTNLISMSDISKKIKRNEWFSNEVKKKETSTKKGSVGYFAIFFSNIFSAKKWRLSFPWTRI
jgi:hypothetical protein